MSLTTALLHAINEDGLMVKGRDLDETRRLLYMVLLEPRTQRYTLAGTLVNALTHHSLELDADEVADQIVAYLNDQTADSEAWLRAQIAELTARTTSAA